METTFTTNELAGKQFKSFSFEYDFHTGCFCWYSKQLKMTVWMTPFWEDYHGVPTSITCNDKKELTLRRRGLWDHEFFFSREVMTLQDYMAIVEDFLTAIERAFLPF